MPRPGDPPVPRGPNVPAPVPVPADLPENVGLGTAIGLTIVAVGATLIPWDGVVLDYLAWPAAIGAWSAQ